MATFRPQRGTYRRLKGRKASGPKKPAPVRRKNAVPSLTALSIARRLTALEQLNKSLKKSSSKCVTVRGFTHPAEGEKPAWFGHQVYVHTDGRPGMHFLRVPVTALIPKVAAAGAIDERFRAGSTFKLNMAIVRMAVSWREPLEIRAWAFPVAPALRAELGWTPIHVETPGGDGVPSGFGAIFVDQDTLKLDRTLNGPFKVEQRVVDDGAGNPKPGIFLCGEGGSLFGARLSDHPSTRPIAGAQLKKDNVVLMPRRLESGAKSLLRSPHIYTKVSGPDYSGAEGYLPRDHAKFDIIWKPTHASLKTLPDSASLIADPDLEVLIGVRPRRVALGTLSDDLLCAHISGLEVELHFSSP